MPFSDTMKNDCARNAILQYHQKIACGMNAEIIWIKPPAVGRGGHAVTINMENIQLDHYCLGKGITADHLREIVENPTKYYKLGKLATCWYEDWGKKKFIYEIETAQ